MLKRVEPFPSPGDFPNPGIKPRSPACRQMLYHEPPGKPLFSETKVSNYYLLQQVHP